ncbi:MAG: polysaccharide biosynthesis C-terminal domain-containing protein [Bacteroidota bacterium]|nr:polysaccharide biosynthesis C-terminal domain-containing protein [Bacteroidota bacterium]
MKRKFFTNLLFLIGLNLLIKPFWVFGIDRVVQNSVGSAEYGLYFSLFNLSVLFNIILDIGLTNFNNRNIAQHKQLLPKYFSNIVVLKFLLAFVYAIITILAGIVVGIDMHGFQLLLLLIFNQFLLSFILYFRSNISGLQKFKIDSLISVLDRALMIIIIGMLLWTNITKGQFKIQWFVYAQTFAYFITGLLAFFIVLYHAKTLKFRINKPFLIYTIKKTFPFALLVLLMSFYNRFDAVLLVSLLDNGEVQAGIYAQSFRLLDAVSQLAILFASLLLPIFSNMIIKKKNVSDLVQFSTFLLLIPSLIFVIPSIIYNSEIISILYTDNNSAYSADIFVVLISAFIPMSTTYIFGTLLTANGNLKHLNIIAFFGVVINLVLNLILIPKFKAQGAAITALSTQIITAILQFVFAIYIFKIKFEIKAIVKSVFFVIVYLLLAKYSQKLFLPWFYSYLFSMFVGFILAVSLGLINIKLMIRILKGYEN